MPKSQERSWNLFMDCLSPQPDHLSTISSRLSSSLPLSIVSWGGPSEGSPGGQNLGTKEVTGEGRGEKVLELEKA